jgi:hypothetical protein
MTEGERGVATSQVKGFWFWGGFGEGHPQPSLSDLP